MHVIKPLDLPPCPPPSGGVHAPWMMTVANKLAHAQVSSEKACLIIREAMTSASQSVGRGGGHRRKSLP